MTVTYKKKQPEAIQIRSWHLFAKALTRKYPYLLGVRVFQLHKLGGIHVHCIINRRIDATSLHQWKRLYGMGWIDLVDAVPEHAQYVARYISRDDGIFGHRAWAAIGGYRVTRNSDIEFDSMYNFTLKRIMAEQRKTYRRNPFVHLQVSKMLLHKEMIDGTYGNLRSVKNSA